MGRIAALLLSYTTTTRKVSRRTLVVVLEGEAVAHHAGAPAIPIAFLPISSRSYSRRRIFMQHHNILRLTTMHQGAAIRCFWAYGAGVCTIVHPNFAEFTFYEVG